MSIVLKQVIKIGAVAMFMASTSFALNAEPMHGISFNGELALPADFQHLPQANPDAHKGGEMVYGEFGGFDAFNPYILDGRSPYGFDAHTVESLMARSYDESFSLYGLIAESIETDSDRTWVEFTLRPEAKFADGSPITVEDVIWSFETMAEKGLPKYAGAMGKVESIEKTADNKVKFTFNTVDRELPLILGLRPILQKAWWDGKDFNTPVDTPPVGSGPYVVDEFEFGKFISFKRNPDYWGNDLPINKGRNNLDTIRYEYFADADVIYEAFKSGETSIFADGDVQRWANYDFERFNNGEVVQSVIPHERPSGMYGFVFNTRRPAFQDWRVREALINAFNFEFVNETINASGFPRIESYFSNSILGMSHEAADGLVKAKLEGVADGLFPGALEGYSLPVGTKEGVDRAGAKRALELFAEAGWTVQDGVLKNEAGEPFTFEILVKASEEETIANLYADMLKPIGITPTISLVDAAQHQERREQYDFDMIGNLWALSLAPGNEQLLYWGSEGVETPGTRNYMGVNSPAAEEMINQMLSATSLEDYTASVKALDRILMSGRYVIPFWFNPEFYVAHDKELKYPDYIQMYGYWLGFAPDVWWYEEGSE